MSWYKFTDHYEVVDHSTLWTDEGGGIYSSNVTPLGVSQDSTGIYTYTEVGINRYDSTQKDYLTYINIENILEAYIYADEFDTKFPNATYLDCIIYTTTNSTATVITESDFKGTVEADVVTNLKDYSIEDTCYLDPATSSSIIEILGDAALIENVVLVNGGVTVRSGSTIKDSIFIITGDSFIKANTVTDVELNINDSIVIEADTINNVKIKLTSTDFAEGIKFTAKTIDRLRVQTEQEGHLYVEINAEESIDDVDIVVDYFHAEVKNIEGLNSVCEHLTVSADDFKDCSIGTKGGDISLDYTTITGSDFKFADGTIVELSGEKIVDSSLNLTVGAVSKISFINSTWNGVLPRKPKFKIFNPMRVYFKEFARFNLDAIVSNFTSEDGADQGEHVITNSTVWNSTVQTKYPSLIITNSNVKITGIIACNTLNISDSIISAAFEPVEGYLESINIVGCSGTIKVYPGINCINLIIQGTHNVEAHCNLKAAYAYSMNISRSGKFGPPLMFDHAPAQTYIDEAIKANATKIDPYTIEYDTGKKIYYYPESYIQLDRLSYVPDDPYLNTYWSCRSTNVRFINLFNPILGGYPDKDIAVPTGKIVLPEDKKFETSDEFSDLVDVVQGGGNLFDIGTGVHTIASSDTGVDEASCCEDKECQD